MNVDPLIAELRGIITQARSHAVRSVNTLQVVSNFLIGRGIVEHEQAGAARAEYGSKLLKTLSKILVAEFGKDTPNQILNSSADFISPSLPGSGTFSRHRLENWLTQKHCLGNSPSHPNS